MKRDEYIQYRLNKGEGLILYNYYLSEGNFERIPPFDIDKFLAHVNTLSNNSLLLQQAIGFYDRKFTIIEVRDKENNILKIT